MSIKKTLLATALVAVGSIGTTAMAATGSPATTQFNVTLTVVAACTVTTPSNIDLGDAVPTGSAQSYSGNTTIAVSCPTGVPFTVGLLPSNNNANGAGQLVDAGGDKINYNLYSNALLSTAWGNTGGTSPNTQSGTGVGTTTPVNLKAYAAVTSASLASAVAGSYSDTVTVSVNF